MRNGDAYNEASLRKEIRFFPNPLVLPWELSPFLNVRDHQSSSLAPTDSTTACYWQAKIRWTKTWWRGKTGACGRRGRRAWKRGGNELRLSSVFQDASRTSPACQPSFLIWDIKSRVFMGVESRREPRVTRYESSRAFVWRPRNAEERIAGEILRFVVEVLRTEF